MGKLYDLTPMGENWGWGARLAEIIVQTIGLLTVQPLVWLHRGLSWLLSRLLP